MKRPNETPTHSNSPPEITFRSASPEDVAFLERLRRLTMYRSVTNHHAWDDEVQRRRVRAPYDSARIICSGGQAIGLLKVVYSPTGVHLSQIQLLAVWHPDQNQWRMRLMIFTAAWLASRPSKIQGGRERLVWLTKPNR